MTEHIRTREIIEAETVDGQKQNPPITAWRLEWSVVYRLWSAELTTHSRRVCELADNTIEQVDDSVDRYTDILGRRTTEDDTSARTTARPRFGFAPMKIESMK